MNLSKESRLLIQATYSDKTRLLEQLLEAGKTHELLLNHLHQCERAPWYVLDVEVMGAWHQLAKFEALLKDWAQQIDGQIFWQRVSEVEDADVYLPYIVQVQTLVNTDIVGVLTEFFMVKGVRLKAVNLERYVQSKTLAPMQTLTLNLHISATLNLPELRENLIILCEQYNVDVIFEQDRG